MLSLMPPSTTTLYTVGTIKDVLVSVVEPVETGTQAHAEISTSSITGTATRKYVSVDGGMSDNIRPALYAAEYSAAIANRLSDREPVLSRVVGKHCEGGDILIRDVFLPSDVSIGDLIAVPGSGAYARSMASNYNQIPKPPVVSAKDGVTRVMLRRETLEDLMRLDVGE